MNSNKKKNNNNSSYLNKGNDKNKKSIKGNIKIIPSNSSLFSANKSSKNSMSSICSMIINSNNNNLINNKLNRGISQNKYNNSRYMGNSLPEINKGSRSISMTKKIQGLKNNLNSLLKEESNINGNNIENIDISMNFLKDLSNNTTNFVVFLKLIQIHMDIELLFDNIENNGNNNNFHRKLPNMINNEKLIKLNNLLNTYFNTLSLIYIKNENIPVDNPLIQIPIDSFFYINQ